MQVDWLKLGVALFGIGGCVALSIVDNLQSGAAIGLIGTIVGYVLGNGRNVAAGKVGSDILNATDTTE